jgi:hypothetical protein
MRGQERPQAGRIAFLNRVFDSLHHRQYIVPTRYEKGTPRIALPDQIAPGAIAGPGHP